MHQYTGVTRRWLAKAQLLTGETFRESALGKEAESQQKAPAEGGKTQGPQHLQTTGMVGIGRLYSPEVEWHRNLTLLGMKVGIINKYATTTGTVLRKVK